MPRSASDGTDFVAAIARRGEAFSGITPSRIFKDVAKPPISEAAQINASNNFSFSIKSIVRVRCLCRVTLRHENEGFTIGVRLNLTASAPGIAPRCFPGQALERLGSSLFEIGGEQPLCINAVAESVDGPRAGSDYRPAAANP